MDYPRDKVIVHQITKGTYAPSLGHFVLKLETYLRIAKIPYEVRFPCFILSDVANKSCDTGRSKPPAC